MADVNDFNRNLIDEFRANHGKVEGVFAGAPLLLLSTTGAQAAMMPTFNDYAAKTDREIPVVVLERVG